MLSAPALETAHFGQDLFLEKRHAAPHRGERDVPDLHVDLHDPVAVFAVQALDLLDHHLWRAAEHEPGIDDLLDRLLHRLADVAELAAIAVLVIARLLQDDALRRADAAAEHIAEIPPPLAHQAL